MRWRVSPFVHALIAGLCLATAPAVAEEPPVRAGTTPPAEPPAVEESASTDSRLLAARRELAG